MANLAPTIWERVMGQALRQIYSIEGKSQVFLTFDDGPDPEFTPQILNLLKQYGAKATFFVVSDRAQKNKKIIDRILLEGHSIGNHSLDHKYGVFFKGYQSLRYWIEESEKSLRDLGINNNVGFRPPVGIRTPELARALKDLGIPMILWKQRSYDGITKFNPYKAKRIIHECQPGDIILLHDKQKAEWRESFLEGLGSLLEGLGRKGFSLPKLESWMTTQN